MMRLRYLSEYDHSGYAVAAQRCVRAIHRYVDVSLRWEPLANTFHGRVLDPTAGADAPAELRALRGPVRSRETAILHSVPQPWSGLANLLGARRLIGHSVWETDRLPARWLGEMSAVDEFWVPTEWNRHVFQEAFGKPVHVIPHIATTTAPTPPPLTLRDDHFVAAIVSEWNWRKRPDRAVEAFCRAFDANDPVTLVIKTGQRSVSWWDDTPPADQIRRIVAGFTSPPHIELVTETWPESELLGLLQRADCLISLTASEGWGLGAFDAACLGTPVIITGYGGQVEWLGGDYPGLLPFRMVPAKSPEVTLFEAGMSWGEADLDAAIGQLRELAAGGDTTLRRRAESLAPALRDRYSEASVARRVERAIGADVGSATTISLRSASPTAPTIAILTPVKDAATFADSWADLIERFDYPRAAMSVTVLVSDSTDGSQDAFSDALERLRATGLRTRLLRRDFGFHLPPGVPRWDPSVQLDRRRVLALSRNHLLFGGLQGEDWALWLDADVIEAPTDIVRQLLAAAASYGADVVHPNCVLRPGGPSFDTNAWTDHGRYHLDSYRGHDAVGLHAVGATMLLVRADRHRDGLVWPTYPYGLAHPWVRPTAEQRGRPEPGEIESEGLALLAADMGIECIGLPDVEIIHYNA